MSLTYPYNPFNPKMKALQDRRASFRYCHHKTEKIWSLVKNGFYFTGKKDYVKCFHCGVGLGEFSPNDDPALLHRKCSPWCPLLWKRSEHENQLSEVIKSIQEACHKMRNMPPKHKQMEELLKRLATFECPQWKRYCHQNSIFLTPTSLANAGFFHTGTDDEVTCYHCDGKIKSWEPNEEPFVEHCTWFPQCPLMQRLKQMEYIISCVLRKDTSSHTEVEGIYQRNNQSRTQSRLEGFYDNVEEFPDQSLQTDYGSRRHVYEPRFIMEEELQACSIKSLDSEENTALGIAKELLCVECGVKLRTMVVLPCGHRFWCKICVRGINICTHCDTTITSSINNTIDI